MTTVWLEQTAASKVRLCRVPLLSVFSFHFPDGPRRKEDLYLAIADTFGRVCALNLRTGWIIDLPDATELPNYINHGILKTGDQQS